MQKGFHLLAWTVLIVTSMIGSVRAEEAPESTIRELIKQLATDSFTHRYIAQASLVKHVVENPQQVLPPLVRALVSSKEDPEVTFRLNETIFSVYRARVINKPRGFLGIRLAPSFIAPAAPNEQLRQVIEVLDIIPDTAAEKANLQLRDKILLVDGHDVGAKNPKGGFIDYIYSRVPGTVVKLKIMRRADIFDVSLPLGERPPDLPMRTTLAKSADELYQDWLRGATQAIENGEPIPFE